LLHALAMEQEKEACEEPSWHAARMEQSQQLHLEHMKLFSDGARYASKEVSKAVPGDSRQDFRIRS
jgi:hypothetical protein